MRYAFGKFGEQRHSSTVLVDLGPVGNYVPNRMEFIFTYVVSGGTSDDTVGCRDCERMSQASFSRYLSF
jgi:hypothetical protein